MNENQGYTTVTYDDNWQNVSVPETPVFVREHDSDADVKGEEEKIKKKPPHTRQLLLIIQLCLCILICIAAYAIKTFGGDLYENLRNCYYSELNKELIADFSTENPELSRLFTATGDEL